MPAPDALTGIFYAVQFDTDLLGRVDGIVQALRKGRVFGALKEEDLALAIDHALASGEPIAKRDVFAIQPRSEEALRSFLKELRRRLSGGTTHDG